MVEMGLAEASDLARRIDSMPFDQVFVMDGSVLGFRWTESPWLAPCVSHDPNGDIVIDQEGWEALTGFTGQQGYGGAVMHPSERIGVHIARHMSDLSQDEPLTFVVCMVESDDPNEEPVGWCILHRPNTVGWFVSMWGEGRHPKDKCQKCDGCTRNACEVHEVCAH